MSESAGSSRQIAECRFDRAQPPPRVAGRPLYDYWAVLQPHVRPVLLPAKWQASGGTATWTWRTAGAPAAPTAADCAQVRRRLADARAALAALAEAPVPSGQGLSSAAWGELATLAAGVCERLATRDDAGLAGFLARTSTGWMVHSWGASKPGTPSAPAETDCEVSGTVVVMGKPGPGHEVILEDTKGSGLARTRSDAGGAFVFSPVAPGRYRVRGLSDHVDFSVTGVSITVENSSVTGVVLCSSATVDEKTATPVAPLTAPSTAADAPPVVIGPVEEPLPDNRLRAPVQAVRGRRLAWRLAAGVVVVGTVLGLFWSCRREPRIGLPATDAAPKGGAPSGPASTVDPTKPGPRSLSARMQAGAPGVAAGGGSTLPELRPDKRAASHENTLKWDRGAPVGAAGAVAEPVSETLSGSNTRAGAPAAAIASGHAPTRGTPEGNAGPAGSVPAAVAIGAPGNAANATASDRPPADATASPAPPPPGEGAPSAQPTSNSLPPSGPASPDPAAPSSTPQFAGGSRNAAGTQTPPPAPVPAPTATVAVTAPAPAASPSAPAPDSPATVARKQGNGPVNAQDSDPSAPTDAGAKAVNTLPLSPPSTIPSPTPTPRPTPTPTPTPRPTPTSARTPTSTPAPWPAVKSEAASGEAVELPGGAVPTWLVRQTGWQARLLRDAILPTGPVPMGRKEDVVALRQRLLRERRQTLPAAFAQPRAWSGIAVQAPAAAGTGGLVWRDEKGDVLPAGAASVDGSRAELTWTAGAAPRDRRYRLQRGPRDGGTAVARVDFDRLGGAAFTPLAADVVGWCWLAVETAGAKAVASALEWRLLHGEGWPGAWRADDRWKNGTAHRLDLHAGSPLPPDLTVALSDPATGWALVADLELVRKTPPRP